MNPTIQLKQSMAGPRERLTKKTKILRNIFISVGVFFAFALDAGAHDSSLDFGTSPLGGGITNFDAPGAGTGPGQGTQGLAINPGGVITGDYVDASNVFHGFVRASDSTFTTFDVPGAGTGFGQGTQAVTSTREARPRGLTLTPVM